MHKVTRSEKLLRDCRRFGEHFICSCDSEGREVAAASACRRVAQNGARRSDGGSQCARAAVECEGPSGTRGRAAPQRGTLHCWWPLQQIAHWIKVESISVYRQRRAHKSLGFTLEFKSSCLKRPSEVVDGRFEKIWWRRQQKHYEEQTRYQSQRRLRVREIEGPFGEAELSSIHNAHPPKNHLDKYYCSQRETWERPIQTIKRHVTNYNSSRFPAEPQSIFYSI